MTAFIDGTLSTPKCKCTRECEFPCWQRIGLTSQPCCPGCEPLPKEDEA